MHRKPSAFILMFSLTAALGSASVFAQNARLDKATIARYENNIEAGKTAVIERPLFDLALANPNNPQVLELLAKLRARQNRLSEAAALYKRILSLDANSAAAKINLARVLYVSGNRHEAKQTIESVDETQVSDHTLRLNLATVFLVTGEPQKALDAIEKLPLKTKNTDALPIRAASYLKLNNLQKLRDLLAQIKAVARASPALATECADILQKGGMKAEAADLLRLALSASPSDFDGLILLAKLEIAQREFVAAKQHLSHAAKLQPRSAQILSARALLEEATGNLTTALESLKQARSMAPDSLEILAQFVITAMRAEQTRTAIEAAQTLVEKQPDEPENLYLLGAAFLQGNNTAEAERNLQRFVKLRPADSRGCLMLGLTLAAQSDQLENARRQLVHCIEIDPANIEARYQLGLSYKAQGETAKAIQYLEQTIESAPNSAPVLRDLGAVYLQSGAENKARMVLEKAVALDPNDADAHFQLSRLYNLTGETALAKKHLEMFQKLKSSPGK